MIFGGKVRALRYFERWSSSETCVCKGSRSVEFSRCGVLDHSLLPLNSLCG